MKLFKSFSDDHFLKKISQKVGYSWTPQQRMFRDQQILSNKAFMKGRINSYNKQISFASVIVGCYYHICNRSINTN